jgi:signal transduction histidine kinase
MTTETSLRRDSFFVRGFGLTVVIGLVLIFVVGVVFAVAYGSQRITSSATDLHKADETLRAATVVRAQVALTVFMATMDDRFGTDSTAAQELSQAEAEVALADLEVGVAELRESDASDETQIDERATEFIVVAETTLALLNAGDVEGARELAEADLNDSFRALVDEAVEIRNELRQVVAASDTTLGHMSTAARFLVAFFIPIAVILTYRELSRRQHDETELRRRLDAERELAIGRDEFIANASHELRTPLAAISGMAMLLAEESAVMESELAGELVEIIVSESNDLGRMVEDLLTTARIDAGALQFTFENIGVRKEVDEVVGSLKRVGVEMSIDCEEGSVRADRLRLRQVIRNLLSNAGKYGGPDVRIEGRREGRTYLIVVSDDGDGLPNEIAANAFQRFIHQGHETATTDSVGLGLSIVHSLTGGMGGSVKYEHVDGRTRFLVRLPLVQSAVRPIDWTTTTGTDATTGVSIAGVASAVAPGVGASGV